MPAAAPAAALAAAGTGRPRVVALRRDLHRHPELAFLEYRTASLVAAELSSLGFTVRAGPEVMARSAMLAPPTPELVARARSAAARDGADPAWLARMPDGQTGVVGELKRGAGPVLVLRFDMDALPVAESLDPAHAPNACGFRSQQAGRMHACGHDGHVAIGLCVAEAMAKSVRPWHGTLRLVFQPAEEGGRGAAPMAAAGIVDDADLLFAAHLGCGLPTGCVAVTATDFLFSQKIDVRFTGRSAHAAMAPQDGANALLAAAVATIGLYGLARHGSAATHVNVGRLSTGSARNAIASDALMKIELRGGDSAAYEHMLSGAERVLRGAALAHGVAVETSRVGSTVGMTSDPEACRFVEEAARSLGLRTVPGWPIGGGDDAALLVRRVQERGGRACYFLIGSTLAAGHHASAFDIDEDALGDGVAVFTHIAHAVLRPPAS